MPVDNKSKPQPGNCIFIAFGAGCYLFTASPASCAVIIITIIIIIIIFFCFFFSHRLLASDRTDSSGSFSSCTPQRHESLIFTRNVAKKRQTSQGAKLGRSTYPWFSSQLNVAPQVTKTGPTVSKYLKKQVFGRPSCIGIWGKCLSYSTGFEASTQWPLLSEADPQY